MLNLRTLTVVVVLSGATAAGCASPAKPSCDTEVSVEPVEIRGEGKKVSDVDLTARVTKAGRPLSGVTVEFRLLGVRDGLTPGSADTDEAGVATLHSEGFINPDYREYVDFTAVHSYRAEVSIFQTKDTVGCVGRAEAPFKYVP